MGERLAPLFLLGVGYFLYTFWKKHEKYSEFVDDMYKNKG